MISLHSSPFVSPFVSPLGAKFRGDVQPPPKPQLPPENSLPRVVNYLAK
jgi:hypothetical protein